MYALEVAAPARSSIGFIGLAVDSVFTCGTPRFPGFIHASSLGCFETRDHLKGSQGGIRGVLCRTLRRAASGRSYSAGRDQLTRARLGAGQKYSAGCITTASLGNSE